MRADLSFAIGYLDERLRRALRQRIAVPSRADPACDRDYRRAERRHLRSMCAALRVLRDFSTGDLVYPADIADCVRKTGAAVVDGLRVVACDADGPRGGGV